MRATVLLAFLCVGCVSFPRAGLLPGTARVEVVQGPVVCGPLGFRAVPLQSRWGEYVRVTVAAPGALRGAVLVHANGVAQRPRAWSSESVGALVVEARFPNEDVDARFALERDRPIDITLTGLAGMCEGAVFTVEHGALVPSIDERAWIVELERRGGPELAARRESARVAAEERRQAHSAQWAARPRVEASVEVRQAHYAQWEERRTEGVAVVIASENPPVLPSTVEAVAVVRTASAPSTSLGGNGVVVVGAPSAAATSPGGTGVAEIRTASAPSTSLGENGVAVIHTVSAPSTSLGENRAVSLPSEWSQPAEFSAEASWSQPFAPRMETVAVSSESQVATRVSGSVEPAYVETSTEVVIVPALFQLLFHLGAAVAAPAPVHAARPIR
ncbi:MAG: hypothetical protein Q8K32_24910 [Archangium sp.]|nr:hypothetical protein [Archangium sp.]